MLSFSKSDELHEVVIESLSSDTIYHGLLGRYPCIKHVEAYVKQTDFPNRSLCIMFTGIEFDDVWL